MICLQATAPGKAILCGEYAVLCGAPALAMAVNRRAIVGLAQASEDSNMLVTPGLEEGEWRFRVEDSGMIKWVGERPAGSAALVEETWRCIGGRLPASISISIDSREFFDPESGLKLGLGSSAAVTTALVSALSRLAEQDANDGSLASKVHSKIQDGLGSGVDVAASNYGGLIEYRIDAAEAPVRRSWPEELCFRFVWSGRPANTVTRVRKFAASDASSSSRASLIASAYEVAAAWADEDKVGILRSLNRYTDALRHFSIDHDLGIFDAGHDLLAELALAEDVLYKPCGAGGGDIGIVIGDDDAALQGFCEKSGEHGFRPLSLAMEPRGISIQIHCPAKGLG